jgi:hypothetical protein
LDEVRLGGLKNRREQGARPELQSVGLLQRLGALPNKVREARHVVLLPSPPKREAQLFPSQNHVQTRDVFLEFNFPDFKIYFLSKKDPKKPRPKKHIFTLPQVA